MQKERREKTIQAQVQAGYELAQIEQRMFHLQELSYEKAREKLEEDELSEWRPQDLIGLIRTLNDRYAAIKKARSEEKPDPNSAIPLTEEQINELWRSLSD